MHFSAILVPFLCGRKFGAYLENTVEKVWTSSHLGSKNGLTHFTLIPTGKIVFGSWTAFQNDLSSKIKVALYANMELFIYYLRNWRQPHGTWMKYNVRKYFQIIVLDMVIFCPYICCNHTSMSFNWLSDLHCHGCQYILCFPFSMSWYCGRMSQNVDDIKLEIFSGDVHTMLTFVSKATSSYSMKRSEILIAQLYTFI